MRRRPSRSVWSRTTWWSRCEDRQDYADERPAGLVSQFLLGNLVAFELATIRSVTPARSWFASCRSARRSQYNAISISAFLAPMSRTQGADSRHSTALERYCCDVMSFPTPNALSVCARVDNARTTTVFRNIGKVGMSPEKNRRTVTFMPNDGVLV